MKQLITILLCLFTLFAEAQVNTNDTNKYFKSYDYGFSYKRLQAREAFIFPTDTIINKLGAVSLNGVIYLGNGTKWTSIGGAGTTPTLQQVTTAGASSTNAITLPALNFYTNGEYLGLTKSSDGSFIINNATNTELFKVNDGVNGYLKFGGGTGKYVQINSTSNANIELTVPSTGGTIPISVNGYTANTAGEITIPTIDTTNQFVKRLERTPGKDSIIYFVGSNRFAIKDSVGGSSQNGRFGNDTATIVMVKVHNDAGVTLTNGKVVALTTSGNNNEAPAVRLANSKGDSTSANTLGFVSGTIANQDTGWVILSGKIEKINTSAYNNGDIIYLDTINGNFTKVKPSAPTHLVYLGVVVKANAGNGAIFVKAQNGYELDEIHDVQINSKLNNQIIVYSDTQKVWKNRSIYSVVDTTTTIATKSNVALKLNISDSATMLSKYLRKIDTASLSYRITLEQSNLDLLQSLSLGIKAEPYGITYANVTSQLGLTSPRLNFYPFNWNVSDSIRGIAFLNRAATTLTATNYNGIAIYSLSGGTLTRLTFTPNSGTFWDNASINTWKTQAITPYYLPKGTYFLGYQVSGSAGTPIIASGTIMQAGFIEPPSVVNTNGIKISSYISNATATPPSSVAFSTTTIQYQVPYFILY